MSRIDTLIIVGGGRDGVVRFGGGTRGGDAADHRGHRQESLGRTNENASRVDGRSVIDFFLRSAQRAELNPLQLNHIGLPASRQPSGTPNLAAHAMAALTIIA